MARPKKVEALTRPISGRIRPEHELWLQIQAEKRFDGELSRTLRWALDQAQTMTYILNEPDPLFALDELLHPEKYEPPDREEVIVEAERELAEWQREQAIKRARKKGKAG
jgi:hypothetical protein